jgi:tRNA A37 methylthiotransferase MiaB
VLADAGYAATSDPGDADLILLNTCAVREKAEERVFGRVGTLATLKAKNPRLLLGITGCMAEHLKEKIHERAPAVDLIVGPDGYRRLADHLVRAEGGEAVQDTVLDRHETYEGLDPARVDDGGVIGRVTIQRGCDKFCTFCVVPYTRGRERGVPRARSCGRCAPGRGRLQGSAAARADGQFLRYEDVRLRRVAARSGRHRRHRARALHLARTRSTFLRR